MLWILWGLGGIVTILTAPILLFMLGLGSLLEAREENDDESEP